MGNEFLEKKKEMVEEELDYLHKRDAEIRDETFIIDRQIEKLKSKKDILKTESTAIRRRLSQLSEEGYLYVASDENKKYLNTDYKAKFDIFE